MENLASTLVALTLALTQMQVALAAAPSPVIATSTVQVTVPGALFQGPTQCDRYRSFFGVYDWPVQTALEICQDESHGNPDAPNWRDAHKTRSGTVTCYGSFGLMQIGCIHWNPGENEYDPAANVRRAYEIWSRQGFCPWSTYEGQECG
jgi:hypothetical protein